MMHGECCEQECLEHGASQCSNPPTPSLEERFGAETIHRPKDLWLVYSRGVSEGSREWGAGVFVVRASTAHEAHEAIPGVYGAYPVAYVNLCPHPVKVLGEVPWEVAACESAPRITQVVTPLAGDLSSSEWGELERDPRPAARAYPGALFVVGALLRDRLGSSRFVSPGRQLRDEQGAVLGCRTLLSDLKAVSPVEKCPCGHYKRRGEDCVHCG